MASLEDFESLMSADAREVAKRSLRHKFGRLSNIRILGVLRPAAQDVIELRTLTDRELLDRWFIAFNRFRIELQHDTADEPRSQSSAN